MYELIECLCRCQDKNSPKKLSYQNALNCLPALLAAARRLLPAHDQEGLDVVVGEELVAFAAAPRLDVEHVVQVLEGGARYVHPPGTKITFLMQLRVPTRFYSSTFSIYSLIIPPKYRSIKNLADLAV